MAALQIAAPTAFPEAIEGTFTGAERGLVVLTIRMSRALDIQGNWAIATVAAIACIIAYALLGALARKLVLAPVTTILAAPPAPRNQEFDGAVNAIWRIVVTTLVVLVLTVL